MEQFKELSSLMVKQQKELAEILTGFETKNRYSVMNDQGQQLFEAEETGGNLISRLFLKALRPFTITIRDTARDTVCHITRPFRFYFHEIQVEDPAGNVIGIVKREFSILTRKYTVLNDAGREIFTLFGPLLHPWTFEIRTGERTVGKITKKWSGLLKEGFTDADNFGVQFPEGWRNETKAIMLGAVFLIDFVHFENKGDN